MNEVWLVILPLIAGYLLDLAFGDPRTIPHPVVGFGNMISWAERHFNCGRFRKWKGAVVALSFPLFVGMIGWGITVGTLAVGVWCFCIVASVFVFYGLANHSRIREGSHRYIEKTGRGGGTPAPVLDCRQRYIGIIA